MELSNEEIKNILENKENINNLNDDDDFDLIIEEENEEEENIKEENETDGKIPLEELQDIETVSELLFELLNGIIISLLIFYARSNNLTLKFKDLDLSKEKKEKNIKIIHILLKGTTINAKNLKYFIAGVLFFANYYETFKTINELKKLQKQTTNTNNNIIVEKTNEEQKEEKPKRKRGRPKGSKNKKTIQKEKNNKNEK